MNIVMALSLVLSLSMTINTCASAADCDCTSYPFKPNPPCYSVCVANLSSNKNNDLSAVKKLDPGVAVGIKVLSESKTRASINFKHINGKSDLEREALKSLDNGAPK